MRLFRDPAHLSVLSHVSAGDIHSVGQRKLQIETSLEIVRVAKQPKGNGSSNQVGLQCRRMQGIC
jgi:hypothetical protein